MCSILARLLLFALLLFQHNHSNMIGNIKSIAPHIPPITPPTITPVLLSSVDPPVEHAIKVLVRTIRYENFYNLVKLSQGSGIYTRFSEPCMVVVKWFSE